MLSILEGVKYVIHGHVYEVLHKVGTEVTIKQVGYDGKYVGDPKVIDTGSFLSLASRYKE